MVIDWRVILSAFLGDTSDVVIILFIVLSTGLLSFFQERNAGRVVEKLQSMIALKSAVIRDGLEHEIVNSLIVTGDESYPVPKENGILLEETELVKRTNVFGKEQMW